MFDDVYLVDDELHLVDEATIVAVERKLGVILPRGYHRFLTTLGDGTYCNQVFLILPDAIEQETADLHDFLREYFFWDCGVDVLPKEKIEQSLLIAHSLDGDELIYHPDSEHGVYVLPRHDDTIYWLSPEFDDPLRWHSTAGLPMSSPSFRYFEPTRGRSLIELFAPRTDHRIADVASTITTSLAGNADTRSIIEGNCQLHFHKAVGSHVQLTDSGDGRIGIRIAYNPKYEQLVAACISQLESNGFYQTGRQAR